MPLTFAHPAAVLPFSKRSKFVNFSAMVFGSMAPDFEYFLRGEPAGAAGHTLSGFFLFNLPLVLLVYFIYHAVVHEPLFAHLPQCLQVRPVEKKEQSSVMMKAVVFICSALFGMATHVTWDSLTHGNGVVVGKFPLLFTITFHLFGYDIPLYKFLQHGSTLLGITLIIGFMFFQAWKRPVLSAITAKRKIIFWLAVFLLANIMIAFWYIADWAPISSYGIAVVRIIDVSLLSLLLVSASLKIRESQAKREDHDKNFISYE